MILKVLRLVGSEAGDGVDGVRSLLAGVEESGIEVEGLDGIWLDVVKLDVAKSAAAEEGDSVSDIAVNGR